MGLFERAKDAYNVFRNGRQVEAIRDYGPAYSYRPDRPRYNYYSQRSVIMALQTRIAVDVSSIAFRHVRLNDEGDYDDTIESPLNECLSLQANIDQSADAFIRDVVLSMLDEGVVAVVPTGNSMRTAKIVQWFPQHVQIRGYNQDTGKQEEAVVPKDVCAIIENPFYMVMNEPNSTLKRLMRKITLADRQDEDIGSGRIDLLIQLPYSIGSSLRKRETKNRRKEIIDQLHDSEYGVAYLDAAERVIQLNRPVENFFTAEVKDLTLQLYNEMGVSENILKGTATEEEENNYFVKTIEPMASVITQEFTRKFLTPTARSQKQSIMYFRNPFRLMPAAELATAADRLTRNEILSSNEIRSIIGYRPSSDPRADQLLNKNLRQLEDSKQENDQNESEKSEE